MATDEDDTISQPSATTDPPTIAGTLRGRELRASRVPVASSADRYEMREALGRGGMGEVIAARDDVLGREVAIKRMVETNPTSSEVARFLREARIQGALDHPAIPPVHELAHDASGRPFFVMKRLTGTTLREILVAQRMGDADTITRYPRERLLRAFADVCLAVELAHTRGVVHRDLKPANIMLGNFGEVFVLDWGVAKVIGDTDSWLDALRDISPSSGTTQVGDVIGTPGYMAPEQQRSEELDGRADVFSLGCILYELLSGSRVPGYKPPEGLRPSQYEEARDVPPELDELCATATAFTPGGRPTARALGQSVQRFLDGDRDLAMRRRLAVEHLARATTAAADRQDSALHRVAIREAGRALAVDPTLLGAADLVGQLMLEPPREVPQDVERAIEADDKAVDATYARISLLNYAGYAAFVPLMFLMGAPKPDLVAAFAVVVAALVAFGYYSLKTKINTPAASTIAIVGNSVLIGFIARMFTPFLVAPCIAALAVFFLVGSPAYRHGWRFALLLSSTTVAIVTPWILEISGVISPTVILTPDHIELRNLAIEIHPNAISVGGIVYACAVVVSAAIVRRAAARSEEDAQQRLHLQAWQLRQLVPEPAESA